MHANFTEETCTGDGDTLELAGATTGSIPFSASYEDGDPVAYVLEDSGGTIKVSGVGTYVSATDDITRNDTWNWNGTVIDNNPSSNITLSGGTHTIRCSTDAANVFSGGLYPDLPGNNYRVPDNVSDMDATDTISTANRMYFQDAVFFGRTVINSRIYSITTEDASCTHFRLGIYAQNPTTGRPGKLLDDSGDLSANVATTGTKTYTLSTPLALNPGRYFFSVVTDSTVVQMAIARYQKRWMTGGGCDPNNNNRESTFYSNGVTGALSSDPTIAGATFTLGGVPAGFK